MYLNSKRLNSTFDNQTFTHCVKIRQALRVRPHTTVPTRQHICVGGLTNTHIRHPTCSTIKTFCCQTYHFMKYYIPVADMVDTFHKILWNIIFQWLTWLTHFIKYYIYGWQGCQTYHFMKYYILVVNMVDKVANLIISWNIIFQWLTWLTRLPNLSFHKILYGWQGCQSYHFMKYYIPVVDMVDKVANLIISWNIIF